VSLASADRRLIPNIGPQGIARRRRQGIAALVAGGLVALGLIVLGRWWAGLAAFPLFWAGALGVLQAREKT
jgi:hypothetical protein